MNAAERIQFYASVLARRQAHSAINDHADIQAIFAAALLLKNATVKAQVMAVLMGALDNADDSAYDSYGKLERADYPNRSDFWAAMFYGSAQGLNEYARDKRAFNWLHARGVM
jgi:hypothetical protein